MTPPPTSPAQPTPPPTPPPVSPAALPGTLAEAVRGSAARWPDRTAWVFDALGESLTFADVERRSAHLAGVLAARGARPGDRVAVLLRNVPEFPLTWLALARLGAAMVPINVNYRSHDAGHLVRDSGARLLVTTGEFTDLAGLLPVDPIFVEDLPAAAPAPLDDVRPDDLVNVQYTSGTTGRPKGCMLSHRYWAELAGSLVTSFPRLGPGDVMLTCQPFHYIDPQWNVAAALLSGARLVVLDRFHPSSFWAKVREHEVTYFYCLGLMPTVLLRMPPDPLDRAHRVRAIQCSAIPPALHAALEERWGAPWYEAFGMTETGADLRVSEEDHDAALGTGCIGRPLPHREVKIVDAEGKPVPPGETGELALRGSGLMRGYLGLPDPFRDGWFHTGDLVRQDAEGRVYYMGRLKDMIRRSGENISAAEVEEVLHQHPEVRVAAVVPVADELRGEEVKAYVVPRAAEPDPEELARFCAERLAYFKVPRYWQFRTQLPMTASERVSKGGLPRERAGAYDSVDKVWR
ncbi:AMP-binding protein [Microbispora sp. ATCC PTA-5024]|uniref:AMP-binding protein n=1 Tax=Microbispora sp. ATCC PTA-5024 TaxID=316330 RepID=UPI0003DBE1AA|nr:AMP-binding protein [Microbispora sp. ATCC PTA-5024]ETK35283.1 acyl-CoA synthetase [Microbispora sp. ATCC PTA-5024]